MAGPPALARVLLVHLGLYLAGALLLVLVAMPIDWDFPSQLSSQNGWVFFTVVILVAALVLGVLEGLPLRFGPHELGWVVAALALAIGLVGSSFFMGDLFSTGGEQSTATRDDVVMSQLAWAAFWLAHTVVVAAVLTLRRRRY